MLNNKEIISQLKSLQKINPAPEWQSFCRERIINKIRFEQLQLVQQKPSFWAIGFSIFHPRQLVHSFSAVMIILMLFLLGGLGAAGAAYYSLPGESLYPVKLKLSKALMLLPGQSDSAKLKQQTEIVRLVSNDLTEVIKTGGNENAMQKAVEIIKKEVDLTNQQFNNIAVGSGTREIKTAQTVKETSNQLRKSLSSAKKVLNSKTKDSSNTSRDNLVKALGKAEAAAQDVKLKSLKIIAEKAETETDGEDGEVNKELLTQDIALAIAEAEQDLLFIITTDGQQKIIKESTQDDNSAEVDDNQLPPQEADSPANVLIKENLLQAKESLANNQLSEALEKVTEAVSIAHQTDTDKAEKPANTEKDSVAEGALIK